MAYNHKEIEAKWRELWKKNNIYKRGTDEQKENYYSLYSFPYPSGDGLHVGHVEGMVANDIAARFERMRGKNAFLPMGWDSFGLPAENFAIKTGKLPQETTENSIENFREQINRLGIGVDWESEVGAHDPNYYKWTQWIFIEFFKRGLVYKHNVPVNWCPKDQTVLANEQVVNGRCERCDTEVIQKNMNQWLFKITDYAEKLYHDLDKVDWPESTKQQQRNWIGRSVGAEISFKANFRDGSTDDLKVFTTRADTLFGVTFMVIAPESEWLESNKAKFTNWEEIERYIKDTKKKTELDRQQSKDKTGVRCEGIEIINPINGEKIPLYVADYVLAGYGTGAIMAVPAHDERDYDFAKKFNLEIQQVIVRIDPVGNPACNHENCKDCKDNCICEGENCKHLPFISDGVNTILKSSGKFTGTTSSIAKDEIVKELEKQGLGNKKITYRLRDWLISRQRYWGCPIPMIELKSGEWKPVEYSELPVLLPTDVDFRPTGESPITRSASFQNHPEGKREVDTMDTFVDSSWYFFRHLSAKDSSQVFDTKLANSWLPTDLYMIGAEHTVLHLLYARFFTKVFYDMGLINFDEPFQKLRHMGTILGPDGRKMSKRWGNVINPLEVSDKYGADSIRMFEMFLGPIDQVKAFTESNIIGIRRFLERLLTFSQISFAKQTTDEIKVELNEVIKKVTDDTESLKFNTAISQFMKFLNLIEESKQISQDDFETFLKLIAPYAPYITDEIYHNLNPELDLNSSIHSTDWPKYNENTGKNKKVTIAIQINGKLRGTILSNSEITESELLDLVYLDTLIMKWVDKSKIQKTIYVQGKILNIIAN
jgi:leucyl-tRNA synthetase